MLCRFILLLVGLSTLALNTQTVNYTCAQESELKLESVVKIWDAAPHNAFTDLIRFQDQWVVAFREAPKHAGGVQGSKIRVITSKDTVNWNSVATIEDPRGDIRDAKLAVIPDGRLMLLTATQLFDTATQRHQSHAWFSKDLENWEGPVDVADADYWTWGIQFHKQRGYSIGYHTVEPRAVRLYETRDGRDFRPLVDKLDVADPYPNESVMVFSTDDTAYCLLRCRGPAQFGISKPPYTDWEWKSTGAAIGGPEMIQLSDGRLLGGGRLYDEAVRTSLFWIDSNSGKLVEALKLPSGGDTSYPGFVVHENKLYISYYSSHEGKSSIYFAVVELDRDEIEPELEPEPYAIGNRREPFIDDYLIEEFAGDASLQLHAPNDREIVIRHDQPWEGNTSAYHTVFHDGEKFRMYYRGSHVPEYGSGAIKAHPEYTCYAESSDGIHWIRPELGLFEFNGSKENNIVLADDPATHDFAPFLDSNPTAPPESRFKAIGRGKGGLYAYQSPDGFRWERIVEEPVITDGAFDSLNVAFYDRFRRRYVDFHRGFRDRVRDIKTTHSSDFLNWGTPEWLQYPGSPLEHLYTNGIVAYHRAPHVFIGLPKRFVPNRNPTRHAAGGVSDAVFMSSRDGVHFHRWAEAVVRPGLQDSRWVNRNNLPAWGIVETASEVPGCPNELSIYTTGDYYTGDGTTLRRHTWRLDGFVSIHASAKGGEILTRPMTFPAQPTDNVAGATNKEPDPWYEITASDDPSLSAGLLTKRPTIIEIPESRSLGKQVTFAATVKDVPAGMRRLFSSYNGGSTIPGEMYFDFDSDGNIGNGSAIRFRYDGRAAHVPSASIEDWSLDQHPHHIAAVWDDGKISIYFDGELVGQGGEAGGGDLESKIGDIRFGEDHPPTSLANEYFQGWADDILILKQALSSQQITQLASGALDQLLDTKTAAGVLYSFESQDEPLTDKLLGDGQQDGQFLTVKEHWIVQRGKTELLLNLSTSARGSVRVELQDLAGQPIEGYSLADCDEIFGDSIAMPVSWNKSTEISSLAGEAIRVRMVLNDADVYAMQIQPYQPTESEAP